MADNDLRAEYERLLEGFTSGEADLGQIPRAILHILRRLGPPDPLDGVEAERLTEREA